MGLAGHTHRGEIFFERGNGHKMNAVGLWAIEVFFKEIKQTLQLSDFIGYNENAVRWQIWTALLTYILLRFIAWQNEWKHTFTRLFTALRGVIWPCLDMGSVLRCCGTASDSVRMRGAPEQAYLPGFAQL